MAGKYQHLRTCAICGKAKGFTRRIGELTVCNSKECVEKARLQTKQPGQAPPS